MQNETERRRKDQNWAPGDRRVRRSKAQPEVACDMLRRAEDRIDAGEPKTAGSPTYDQTQRLLREVQRLTEINGELEAFNATVSHDLCMPITSINGYCQVLTRICRDQLDDQAMEYLDSIYEGTLQMKRLISSLLDFSSITRSELRCETIDLSALADEAAAQLMLSAPQRPVTFRIERGLTAEGDRVLCRSVLDNLMGNAWKYCFDRKKTISEFGATQQAGKPVYFIRDNGPGFDMALAERIFAPFQRIPGTEVKGHGIGLATVDRIVRRHGGQVWAESKPGRGATFFFTMGYPVQPRGTSS